MIEESKYCNELMQRRFNKELTMTKEDNEHFKNSAKSWIWDNDYIDTDVKTRDHYHITGKYRVSAHRDCNIDLKLNHKIPILFHKLKNYDSHLILQELGKFDLQISAISNGLEIANNKSSIIN